MKEQAKRNMIYGGLWAVGGTAVTLWSQASASDTGGYSFVFWGAIVFGAIQFFWGVSQLFR